MMLVVALLAGCTGSSAEPQDGTPSKREMKAAKRAKAREVAALVPPTPLELRTEVSSVGLKLYPIEVRRLPRGIDGDPPAVGAARAGVLVATILLGTASGEDLGEQGLVLVQTLRRIQAPEKAVLRVEGLVRDLRSEKLGDREFRAGLDEAVKAWTPTGGWEKSDDVMPRVVAGAWLAGLDAVARTVLHGEDQEASRRLLMRDKTAGWLRVFVVAPPDADETDLAHVLAEVEEGLKGETDLKAAKRLVKTMEPFLQASR